MLTWKVAPQPVLTNTLQLILQRAEELAWTASQLPSSRLSGGMRIGRKPENAEICVSEFFTLMDYVGILLGSVRIVWIVAGNPVPNYRERVGGFSVLT